jgi:predicted DNA-binding protein
VIRAILHLLNDQPLAVDLLEEPKPGDSAVICTNVRTIDGKRPVFIDFTDSTFVFPMASVRFVEVPTGADDQERARAVAAAAETAEESEDLEIDEDFLRRVREA